VPVPQLKMLSAVQYFTITAHKDNSGLDLFEALMGSDRKWTVRVLILGIRTSARKIKRVQSNAEEEKQNVRWGFTHSEFSFSKNG